MVGTINMVEELNCCREVASSRAGTVVLPRRVGGWREARLEVASVSMQYTISYNHALLLTFLSLLRQHC